MHNNNTNNIQQPSFDNQSKQQGDMTSSELNKTQERRPLRSPKARLFQCQSSWTLQLALPNVHLEKVMIEEQGQDLYIYAENEQERFKRIFKLPPNERFTEIQAELSKGVLSIEIHVASPDTRKIEVRAVS